MGLCQTDHAIIVGSLRKGETGLREESYIWVGEWVSLIIALAVVILLPEGPSGRWRSEKAAGNTGKARAAAALIQRGLQVSHVGRRQKAPAGNTCQISKQLTNQGLVGL